MSFYPMKNTQTKRLIAKNLILKCGVPPKLVGFKYLTKAVELYADGEYDAMKIYKRIAATENIHDKRVARDIAYAIEHSYNLCQKLSALVGTEIPESQIHNGLVISYLAEEMKNIYYETD